jgi:hypothetical protein
MMRAAALSVLFLLGACQTLPAVVVTGGETFDVRFDAAVQTAADADAKASQHCGGPAVFVSAETRFDGFSYRTYRCSGR